MTFDELKLAMAIGRADLGGGDWISERQRREAACLVYCEWLHQFGRTEFPFRMDDIERLRLALRKNTETRVKVLVAMQHGATCYFDGRGKGPCSEVAECGHIVPRSEGGGMSVENCQIECRAHNGQRGVLSIEEYMRSELATCDPVCQEASR